jgi:hypothetical protein
MLRFAQLVVTAAFFAVISASSASAAATDAGAPAAVAAPALGDLFTVAGIKVDATAESATIARDIAMAQGRPQAWTTVYRRLTATANWGKQPQLDDNQLLRLVRSFEVAGERRSTTRYLAEVTYHFNPAAVRAVLRQNRIAYTETRSKPAVVIPIIEGKGFTASGPWAAAWKDPAFTQGLVPMILPVGDAEDMAIFSREDFMQLDWMGFAPLVSRYDAGAVVLAIASEDGNTVQSIEITQMARTASSFAFAQSTFTADAAAVADKVQETWKTRTSVDFGTRGHLVADVQFNSLAQWARIRSQLRAVKSVVDVDIVGLSANEAEIDVTYFGRIEQLQDSLSQQSLALTGNPTAYTLQLGTTAAANAP